MSDAGGPHVEDVLRWWGLARYEPDEADVREIAAVVREGDATATDGSRGDSADQWYPWTRAELARDALAWIAADGPRRVTRPVYRLVEDLPERHLPTYVAGTVGEVAATDDWVRDELLAHLPNGPSDAVRNAAVALARTAERQPMLFDEAVADLVWTYGRAYRTRHSGVIDDVTGLADGADRLEADDADDVLDAVTGILGSLAAVDESTQIYLRELLTAADPARRACGARALGEAIDRGAAGLEDAIPEMAGLLGDVPGVATAALAGLADAARTCPGPVAAEVGPIYEAVGRLDGAVDGDRLGRICRADPDVFDAVLARFVDHESWSPAWYDDGRVETFLSAIRSGADAYPERFARHEGAVERAFYLDLSEGARIAERAGRWRPELFGDAVDRILRGRPPKWSDLDAVAGTLATLAPAHRRIPERLQRTLLQAAPQRGTTTGKPYRTRGRDPYAPGWNRRLTTDPPYRRASLVVAEVAAPAPDAVLSVAREGEPNAVTCFRNLLDGPNLDRGTTLSLARLGRYDPRVVRPVADLVAWRLPEALGRTLKDDHVAGVAPDPRVGREWSKGLFELGGVAARVAPRAIAPVADDLLDDLWQYPDLVHPAVGFLRGLVVGNPEYAGDLVEFVDRAPTPALDAIADAARDCPGAFLRHVDRLVAASTGYRTDGSTAAATRALATIATGLDDLGVADGTCDAIRERLETLVYDPNPAIRRWAAFGLGELAAANRSNELQRVERVHERGEEAVEAARLALVRAGMRPASASIPALGTVASECVRPMGGVALSELIDADRQGVSTPPDCPDPATAIDRVRATASDPAIHRRARQYLGQLR